MCQWNNWTDLRVLIEISLNILLHTGFRLEDSEMSLTKDICLEGEEFGHGSPPLNNIGTEGGVDYGLAPISI